MAQGLKRVALYTFLGFLGLILALVLAGGAVGFLAAHGSVDPEAALVWVMGGFAILIMLGSLAVGVGWMRAIDEAAREAHKTAWFWGGSAGLAVGGVAIIMASLPQAETVRIPAWFAGRSDPVAYAATGAFGMLLLMLIGYTLAWVWWWWRRR
ncbi:hypothetical protein [Brevundimonas viscosa]|uniref:Uncharacterized protein n=1 Tax=Brevundimonas viscosa TaxID=871741 RepID=A0A1I6TKG3_9CAUL|nr:hypothetical protein [Brevundimonas viscosa]SFS89654.1 hypothetical protein SAMN05192570_0125 [Brevundimonas viscosa]